jgi:hypothetical protein
VTSQTVWAVDQTVGNAEPIMAMSGGLLFQSASNDGRTHTYTGEEVWSFRVGSQFAQSAVSYLGPDGRQYVAIIAGASSSQPSVAPSPLPRVASLDRESLICQNMSFVFIFRPRSILSGSARCLDDFRQYRIGFA